MRVLLMNPDGLVTVDYSDVTVEALDAYREALIADGFEPYDLGTGVEAYARLMLREHLSLWL